MLRTVSQAHISVNHTVRQAVSVSVIGAALLLAPLTLRAQDTRLAAFGLQCFRPTLSGLHTHASLLGKIRLEKQTIRFSATCDDGASTSPFPEIPRSAGAVESVEVTLVTTLENAAHGASATNRCAMQSHNGFLTLRCLADATHGGDVDVLVSIAH